MAKTINLRDVDDGLVKAAKRRALDEDTSLKGYIVGLMQKDLNGKDKKSRSASTREESCDAEYPKPLSPPRTDEVREDRQSASTSQSGTESKTYEKGCQHRFSEPCDDCKKGKP